MSTGLIVAIVVAALVIVALLVLLPRMRATARHKQAERELHSRRDAVAGEHRAVAAEREDRAEMAEQKARMAEQDAQRELAEANMQNERADMHERGRADHELIGDDERDRFEGVANEPGGADRDTMDRDAGGRAMDDRDRTDMGRDAIAPEGGDVRSGATGEYEQGRQDERRFERERSTDDVRDSERTQR